RVASASVCRQLAGMLVAHHSRTDCRSSSIVRSGDTYVLLRPASEGGESLHSALFYKDYIEPQVNRDYLCNLDNVCKVSPRRARQTESAPQAALPPEGNYGEVRTLPNPVHSSRAFSAP